MVGLWGEVLEQLVCSIKNKVPVPCCLSACVANIHLCICFTEYTLEPCHLHLVLSTCLIALVVVAVDIKNIILLDMLIKLGEGDKAQRRLP